MPADGVNRPSFTPAPARPATPTPAPARPASPAPAATQPRSGSPFGASPGSSTNASSASPSLSSSPSPSTSSSSPSGQQGSAYSTPSAYSPPQSYAQPNYSRSAWQSAQETADPAESAGFGAASGAGSPNGAGPRSATLTQSAPSDSAFSSTATAAAAGISGAAAGLAGSVSGYWQKRSDRKASKGSRGPTVRRRSNKRQAMLTLSRVEPWSVMKFSFVASVVAFIILFVAVAVLYMVLSALGVFDSLQHQVSSITSSQSSSGTNISHWFSASLILGYTAMLGALNIVLITALSTIGSVIYNLIAKTVGGVEVTLRETD
jgi:hypothetical protein